MLTSFCWTAARAISRLTFLLVALGLTLVVLGDLDQQSLLFQHIDFVLCRQLHLSAGLMSLDSLPYMTPELSEWGVHQPAGLLVSWLIYQGG